MMKIEVWSDYICPYCYISNINFEKALAAFPEREKVELIHHAFQLHPDTHYDSEKDYYQNLAEITHKTIAEVKESEKPLLALMEEHGVEANFEKIRMVNTGLAHKLTYFAAENGLVHEWVSRIFKAYFLDGLNIADEQTLSSIATELGLSSDEVSHVLRSDKYEKEMQEAREEAYILNFETIPFYRINGQTQLPVTLSSEEYLEVLKAHA